jgi:hypothetical protein
MTGIATWSVGVMLSLCTVASASGPPTPTPASACQESCYQAKSTAYQHCRSIPPSNRAARLKCFKEADQALKRCLKKCR